jgi:hypothetical protein
MKAPKQQIRVLFFLDIFNTKNNRSSVVLASPFTLFFQLHRWIICLLEYCPQFSLPAYLQELVLKLFDS